MEQLNRLEAEGVPFALQWTAGHPERRGAGQDTWSFEDWAIWEADDVARPRAFKDALREEGLTPRAEVALADLVVFALGEQIS
jgi:hypothetical protein